LKRKNIQIAAIINLQKMEENMIICKNFAKKFKNKKMFLRQKEWNVNKIIMVEVLI